MRAGCRRAGHRDRVGTVPCARPRTAQIGTQTAHSHRSAQCLSTGRNEASWLPIRGRGTQIPVSARTRRRACQGFSIARYCLKPPKVDAPEQAVILLLRQDTGASDGDAAPAGLVEIGGRPFVDFLIENCLRFGFPKLLLLSNDTGDRLTNFAAAMRPRLPCDVTLDLHVAP